MDEERKKCSVTFEDENIHKDEQNLHKLEDDDVFDSDTGDCKQNIIIYPEDISSDFETDLDITPPPIGNSNYFSF